jgi:hypothetical protein
MFGSVTRCAAINAIRSAGMPARQSLAVRLWWDARAGLRRACSCGDRIGESGRSEFRERSVAVLLPHPVQRLDARCREGIPGLEETLVQVITP